MATRLTTLIVVSIVAATFIAGIIARAQRDDDGPVDLIVYNGKVYTGRGGKFAEAVAVRGNTIVRVGSNREIKRLRRPQTTYIDAHGGAVVPGFNDARVEFDDGDLPAPGERAAAPAAGPPADREQRLAALRASIQTANALGITSIHNLASTSEEIELWSELHHGNELTVRTYHTLSGTPDSIDANLETLETTRLRFGNDPMFKTGSVEIVAGRPSPVRRKVRQETASQERLNGLVTLLDRRGWQVSLRAGDDEALNGAIEAIEAAIAANPVPERGRRHRIEYAGELTPEEAQRLADLGIVVSILIDDSDVTTEAAGLTPSPSAGDAVPDAASAWRAMGAAGGNLTLASDGSAGPVDPRIALQRVLQHVDGAPIGALTSPLFAAIDAYTSGAAYASFDEQRKGMLAGGMLADIVILSADIFGMPPERLMEVQVETTIVDGEVVYSRE